MGDSRPHKRLSDRGFGLLFGGILIGITALSWFVARSRWTTIGVMGAVLVVLALAAPGLLMPLNRIWDALTRKLVPFTNGLFLGLFFYLMVVPMGLGRRLFDRDPLERRQQPEAASYWAPVQRQVTAETLEDMF